MPLRDNVPLAPLTTLRLGGPAARVVDLDREDDVAEVIREATSTVAPFFVLGGGSNVVVADEGFPGVVARVAFQGIDARVKGGRVWVDVAAGETWDTFVARAIDEGWSGLECMSGIPGLVGGTPIQNVGAYGQEVSDSIAAVRVFDREASGIVTLLPGACGFGYRTSLFKRNDQFVVTRVQFALEVRADSAPIRYAELARALSLPVGGRAPLGVVRDAVLALRRGKGMLLDPTDPDSVSVGSFFVNPIVEAPAFAALEKRAGARPPAFGAGEAGNAGQGRMKVAAAWLVEQAGFPKGFGTERVGVSTKHALALVNRGGATARELVDLARTIRDGVWARFGVELEPEPVFVGCAW